MKLTDEERVAQLRTVPAWRFDAARGGSIVRDFEFGDFVQAFGFMSQAALVAERSSHHPEWSNVYNRVRVVLTTHDDGGLSMKDIELARAMDRMASMFNGQE